MSASGAPDLLVRTRAALLDAGFLANPLASQPGAWTSPSGVSVDLMVPEALAGEGGRRGARIPPHGKRSTRRAVGLEAAAVGTETFVPGVERLRGDPLSSPVTEDALVFLGELFATGPGALGCVMAGSAERTIGDPARVAASVHAPAPATAEAATAEVQPMTTTAPAPRTASQARVPVPRSVGEPVSNSG